MRRIAPMHHLTHITVVGYALSVAAVDTLRHRIPNWLTVSAAGVGLLLGALTHGAAGLIWATEGMLVGFLLLLPLYLLGGFGAGDVKAFAAAGSLLGAQGVALATICTLLIGGIGALGVLLAAGGIAAVQSMLGRWTFRAYVLCSTGRSQDIEPPPGDPARRRFPYGIAIACGIAASLLWG